MMMQQLILVSSDAACAARVAQTVLHALPVRAVGFRMLPYQVAGQTRGELLHFFAGSDPLENDVPCTLRLSRAVTLELPEVWTQLAAPALKRCLPRHAPILLDRLTEAALDCPAFAQALEAALMGESPVLALTSPALLPRLAQLAPKADLLSFSCDNTAEEELACTLAQEITLRL